MDKIAKMYVSEYVAVHGFGEPTGEGLDLAEKLYAQGDDYATIAHEVVSRGMTTEPDN